MTLAREHTCERLFSRQNNSAKKMNTEAGKGSSAGPNGSADADKSGPPVVEGNGGNKEAQESDEETQKSAGKAENPNGNGENDKVQGSADEEKRMSAGQAEDADDEMMLRDGVRGYTGTFASSTGPDKDGATSDVKELLQQMDRLDDDMRAAVIKHLFKDEQDSEDSVNTPKTLGKTIVIALDDSDSKDLVQFYCHHIHQEENKVTLLHCPTPSDVYDQLPCVTFDKLNVKEELAKEEKKWKNLSDMVQKYRGILSEAGIEADVCFRPSFRAGQETLPFVLNHNVDTVLVGTHASKPGVQRVRSTCKYVLDRVPCAVIVYREQKY